MGLGFRVLGRSQQDALRCPQVFQGLGFGGDCPLESYVGSRFRKGDSVYDSVSTPAKRQYGGAYECLPGFFSLEAVM